MVFLIILRLFDGSPLLGIFHSSSNGYCSWYDLAYKFFQKLSVESNLHPCSTSEYPTKAIRPKNSILHNYRLKELEIDSFLSWEDDLNRFVYIHGELIKNNWSQI